MKTFHFCFVGLFALGCLACSNSEIKNSQNFIFDTIIDLTADPIPIKEIINPMSITKLEDYIVIGGEVGGNSDLFYVYALPDLNFLYSFGRTGRGPNEFLMPTIVQNTSGNTFQVYDNPTYNYYSFDISASEAHLNFQKHIQREIVNPFQAIAAVNDSIILYNILGMEGNRLYSLNINTSNNIDSIQFVSGLNIRMGNTYNPTIDTYHFDYNNGTIIVAHRFIDEISMIQIDSNYHFTSNTHALQNSDFTPFAKFYQNINYYTHTHIGDKNIFAQRVGRPMQELQPMHIGRNFKFNMEVFDKNLQPVALLRFNKNMFMYIVDEKHSNIYSWDPLDSFDFLYKYTYNIN